MEGGKLFAACRRKRPGHTQTHTHTQSQPQSPGDFGAADPNRTYIAVCSSTIILSSVHHFCIGLSTGTMLGIGTPNGVQ